VDLGAVRVRVSSESIVAISPVVLYSLPSASASLSVLEILLELVVLLVVVVGPGFFGMEATPDLPGCIVLVVDLNCA
jgi:hypothetical protein